MIILFPPGKSFQWVALMLVGLLLGLMGCKPPAGDVKSMAAKPNFVLIVIDDLGYGDLGSYGSKLHKTPFIDRLAEEGIRFTDFHTNGPVCSPTRAALMTGQYQQRSGIESAIGFVKDEGVALSKVTIADILSDYGYACGVVGKWHLGHVENFGPNDQGFDLSYCSNNSPDYHSHVSRNGEVDWYRNHKLHQEFGYITDLVTRHSQEFIEAHKEEPFFLFVSHPAVHFPYQGPTDPPFRTEGKEWNGSERIAGQVQADSKYGPLRPEEYKRAYRQMLEAVDQSVGAIVKSLEKLNLHENTLIVITSDNGAYSWVGSNGQYRGQKGDLFEGGHRVPAIFNWAGKLPGGLVCDETTATMDLAPTFVTAAGIKDPRAEAFDGADLSDVIFKNASLPPRKLFWRFDNAYTNSHAHAVRHGDWKVVEEGGETFLFDLTNDPGEQTNLASANPQLIRDLKQDYLSWEKDVTGSTE
jgi:arylsulfatase A